MANKSSDAESADSSENSSAGNSTDRLRPPTGAKSKVWKYFRFATNEAGIVVSKTRVKCTLCKHEFNFSGNTTNLSYHLERKHPEQFSECCSVKQGSAKAAAASRHEDQLAITECFETSLPLLSVLLVKHHTNVGPNTMKRVKLPW